ncbi:DUF169 domain-containing protein [Bacillus solimangrovi]|uniref:DUF169 domain-containing protein n=1 Tax=Bacillus solimangrovi TaxID=1305675 RepID=A0A1E5LF51_9BACI|nr:DUF169 domain-containing protein [Bacillus solimangrovi]OEH92709.1 hypothetical protein BFG57_01510 [Bacillus solimangrovi]
MEETVIANVEKIKQLNEAIEKYVRPDTFPLSIRVMDEEELLPPKVKRPKKDLHTTFTICQAVTMSRRYGWAMAMGAEDQSCPIAKIAFGYEDEVDFYKKGNLPNQMYTKTCSLGEKTENAVPKFSKQEAGTILIAPLTRTTFEPELFVMYANSAQVMRMVAAALYTTGGEITSSFSSRADCADLIVRTKQTNKPQVILPCYGDRIYGQTQDHEMAFTIPASMIDGFIEGLHGTHKGGVRYPIPTYLKYEAEFPETYQMLNKMFEE